jgi:hypothetical protein
MLRINARDNPPKASTVLYVSFALIVSSRKSCNAVLPKLISRKSN